MVKVYKLNGLGCAKCASDIERSVKALKNVSSASVNFMASTLQVDVGNENVESITQIVKNIVHSHEPDVIIIEYDGKVPVKREAYGNIFEGESKRDIARIIIGTAIFGCGIFLSGITSINQYTSLAVFIISYLILGGDIILRALKNILRGRVFDENFLMGIATIGAFILGEYPEAVAVMLFYQVGEWFQEMAVRRSKKSITELMDIRPDYANLKINGEIIRVEPDDVKIGDIIIVKPGEKIPLDGVVIEGESMLDTMALTGESIPRKAIVSDVVLSGCINLNGVLVIEATKLYRESTVAKIIDLVENAGNKKAPTENFITTFSRYYTPAVVGLAALIAIIPPVFAGGIWTDWIHRGLIFLVISCPCALVVSIPLSFFCGIGSASKKGILVKGGNFLEALSKLDIVVFDKTGTLTKGVFKVTDLQPTTGFTADELLELAAHAEVFSNHPIAVSIIASYNNVIDKTNVSEYTEHAGYGVSVNFDGKTILAGNHKLMVLNEISFAESHNTGTKVYVAKNNIFAGCIVISDEIKPDSQKAIADLKKRGVRKTIMLTGDSPQIAESIARELKLDEAFGGLLPGQKVEKVELIGKQKCEKGKLAYIGDGINDAPVLAGADVGIAMGGLGSDAAIEAADVVLMTDEPSKLADAIDVSRFTKRVVWQNIIFALGVKGIFMLLGTFGIATMWEAVFADVGVALLAVLNATRVMKMR